MGRYLNLKGTTETAFKIGKALLDASGLTAARTHTLPDKAGTFAMLSDLAAGSTLNTAQASGAGPTLTTTEATIGTVTITGVDAGSTVLIIARCNPVKDATTTVRQATFRVRRGSTNASTQVGRDSAVESTAVASTPFGGSASVLYVDTGHGGGDLTYTLRGLATVTSVVTTPNYELVAIELKGVKGDTGATGPMWNASTVTPGTPAYSDITAAYSPLAGGLPLSYTWGAIATLFGLASGTWTPTATGTANVDSVTIDSATYARNGDIVTFAMQVTIDATTSGANTTFTVPLPVASTFTAISDAAGVVAVAQSGVGFVRADTATNRLLVQHTATSGGAVGLRITGQYQIK